MEDAEGMLDDVCVSVSVLRSCNTHLMSDYRGLSSPVFLCTGGCLDCELVVANARMQEANTSHKAIFLTAVYLQEESLTCVVQ